MTDPSPIARLEPVLLQRLERIEAERPPADPPARFCMARREERDAAR
jgi:hypothetical protein